MLPVALFVRMVPSLRSPRGPFLNLIVTGTPGAAPVQVTVTGVPTATVDGGKEVNINCATAEAAMREPASNVL